MRRRDILKGFAAAAGLALAAHAEDAAVKPGKGIADMPMTRTADGTGFFVPEPSKAMVVWAVTQMGRTSVKVAIGCNELIVETDFRDDLRAVSVPSLVIHGTRDASSPMALTGQRTASLIPGCTFKAYEDAPHGLIFTHMHRLSANMQDFI
ncbi:MAG: alpha/beta fold hydrolase [Rhizomicrobium sp.]